MEEQARKGGSKFLYVLLALGIIALIGGGVAWFRATGQSPESVTTQTPTPQPQPSTDPKTEVKGELATTLSDLDTDLGEITLDEESDDDTVDF